MKTAIYPGSFDPLTNGHIDILERGLKIFDEITVVVASTGMKTPLFSPDQRLSIIREATRRHGKNRIKVDTWDGLIMDYARRNKKSAVIRGLRAASDFEYEFMMASMNRKINSSVETIFIMSSPDLYFVSSTMIKELYRYGGDITPYVPKAVVKALKGRK